LTKAAVGVLALQGDFREHAATLERCGARVSLVRLPEDLRGLQGMVVPGGESTTMSKLLISSGLLEPLLNAIESGLTCLTTCAGTILAAREIRGGIPDQVSLNVLDIAVRRNAFGRQLQSAEVALAVPALGPEPVPVAFIRAPAIEEVGAGVEVLASYEERIAAVRQGAHIGLTFHPELTGDTRLHQLFLSGL
jgi:5'-phosphate synthase pdxT subunit